jgi:hypothetical protein
MYKIKSIYTSKMYSNFTFNYITDREGGMKGLKTRTVNPGIVRA